MDEPEDLKAYLLLDADAFAAQMSGNSKAWLQMVRRKSDLLEERTADRGLYLLHAATNGGVFRALLYAYGLVRMDPTCLFVTCRRANT